MNQRADTGDQQDEADRQRIDEEVSVRLQARDRNPGEQMIVDPAISTALADQVEEEDDGKHERRQGSSDTEVVAPFVGAPTADKQDERAEKGDADEQPGTREGTAGSGERRSLDAHGVLISTSADWHRRPKPTGGYGTRRR